MEFRTYDSFEEMQADMARNEQLANQHVTDQQRAIGHGDHFMRPLGPDYDHLMVFGRVQSVAEAVASELLGVTEFSGANAYTDAIATASRLLAAAESDHATHPDQSLLSAFRGETPIDAVLARIEPVALGTFHLDEEDFAQFVSVALSTVDSHARGYRFGKCYSRIEPTGEYGSTHISTMIPLAGDEFTDAQRADWDFTQLCSPASAQRTEWAVQMVLRGGASAYSRRIPEGTT